MPCSWCGVDVGTRRGLPRVRARGRAQGRLLPPRARRAVGDPGRALGARARSCSPASPTTASAAARTAAARWATAASCSSATAASTASPTPSAASITCWSGRRPAGAGRRRASAAGGAGVASSAGRLRRCAAPTASPRGSGPGVAQPGPSSPARVSYRGGCWIRVAPGPTIEHSGAKVGCLAEYDWHLRAMLRHRYVTFEVASYCGLIPAASMIRAALSLSRSTNRVKSGCVMLIGSPPCFTSEARTPGSDRARAMSSASV